MIFKLSLELGVIANLSTQQTPFSNWEKDMTFNAGAKSDETRRTFVGGSDARIIMGDDEAALLRLWREKRGEAEPEDLTCIIL